MTESCAQLPPLCGGSVSNVRYRKGIAAQFPRIDNARNRAYPAL